MYEVAVIMFTTVATVYILSQFNPLHAQTPYLFKRHLTLFSVSLSVRVSRPATWLLICHPRPRPCYLPQLVILFDP
jgi:hypothetical protein